LGVRSWELGVRSWELGVRSWELGVGSFQLISCLVVQLFSYIVGLLGEKFAENWELATGN
jgi:hypothetical protein